MHSEFDLTVFWKDQETVTLYHGTTIDRFETITENGLTLGDDGKIYFTTSPTQARQYARMNGEKRYLADPDRCLVDDSETIILKLEIPPALLNLSGGGAFKDRNEFYKIYDFINDNNGDNFDWPQLEYWTNEPVDAGLIDEIF